MKDGILHVAGEEITRSSLCKLFLSESVLTQVVTFHVRVAGACVFTHPTRRTQSIYAFLRA